MYRILISAYNEGMIIYKTLKSNIKHASKIIVIDDGSTDNTWDEIKRFSYDFPDQKFKKIRMRENGKKVLSIKRVIKTLPKSIRYVILLDADTTLTASIGALAEICKKLELHGLEAATFKINVKNKESILCKILDIEYKIKDLFDSFASKCNKIRCLAGCGSIFNRDILEKTLDKHSGEYYGEDLETTSIILENEYKIGYFPEIITNTIIPSDIPAIIRQRVRWESGGIRVYIEKIGFYIENLLEFNRYSFLWLLEISSWILFPFFLYNLVATPNNINLLYFGLFNYAAILASIILRNQRISLQLMLLYPFLYLPLTLIARIMALGWLVKYYLRNDFNIGS